MSDPTLSEALAEAYASAPHDTIIIETLSFHYEGLQVEGANSEIYLYSGYDGDTRTAEGVPQKAFRLEAGARFFAGQRVVFTALPFDVKLPDVGSVPIAKGQLTVDGVGREVVNLLVAAAELGKAIEVTYRPYLSGLEDSGPQRDPPLKFGWVRPKAGGLSLTGDIETLINGNKRFPGRRYRRETHPGLAQ